MKYFLFYKSGRDLDYCGKFRTLAAVRKRIDKDIALMKKQWPDLKWCKTDYVVARRVK